jgi:DNA gyrase/topoisomerase IV subunit A
VHFGRGRLAELEADIDKATGLNGVEKLLKLSTTVGISNMNMFNFKIQLHKYRSVREVIDSFYEMRMDMYGKRKTAMVKTMETKVREMSNRARFIQEVVDNTIDLRKMADDEATDAMLLARNYDKHDDKYDYLTRMPMHNMNKQRIQKILKEKE